MRKWICLLALCSSAFATDLGVRGTIFPIKEQDLLKFIHARLEHLQQTGEMKKWEDNAKEQVKKHILRPNPVGGISTTANPHSYTVDPSLVIHKDIVVQGHLIAHAGDVINPFKVLDKQGIKFNDVFFFINADDPRQIEWAKQEQKKYHKNNIKIMLTQGNIRDTAKKLGRIYFDQDGKFSHRFQINHVPTIVEEKDDLWNVQEYKLL